MLRNGCLAFNENLVVQAPLNGATMTTSAAVSPSCVGGSGCGAGFHERPPQWVRRARHYEVGLLPGSRHDDVEQP